MGLANTSFSDTDFTIVGIVFGNLTRFVGGNGIFGIIVVLFFIPIIYNFVAKKPEVKEQEA